MFKIDTSHLTDCTYIACCEQAGGGGGVAHAEMSTSSVINVEDSGDAVQQSTSESTISDSMSGSTTSDSVSGPSSNIEPVSVVVSRCLQKATTAPPTIKHFFKPKPLANDVAAKSSENDPERNDTDCSDEIVDKVDDDDVIVSAVEQKHVADKTNSLQQENTAGNSCKTAASNTSAPKPVTTRKPPPAKKHKQSSIEALFSHSAARNPQKQPRVMQCPICSRVFDEASSNVDINQHIDGCLIE